MKKSSEKTSEQVSLTTVIKNKSSQTLLDFLCRRFHYLTRSQWRERVQDGRVTVNEHAASEGQPLRAGDVVVYVTESWEEPEVNKNYRVVYEDHSIFVVSKPAPLPVHAIGAYFQNTLMAVLRKDILEAKDYQLVHRLDAETSGLLVLVKDKKYLKGMLAQWNHSLAIIPSPSRGEGQGEGAVDVAPPSPLAEEGRVRGGGAVPDEGAVNPIQKTYRAIVFGKFPEGPTRVEAPIGMNKESAVRMKLKVDRENGKPSVTEFKLLEAKQDFSLVEARILTGRTHQIRVHLEHLGYPIVGDKLYSGTDETFLHFYEKGWDEWLKVKLLLPRLALHAFKLEFTHPVSGERVVLEDPMPLDLMTFWSGF